MKERIYDVIKWGLIIVIAGVVFYYFGPKYFFPEKTYGLVRCNTINGQVEQWVETKG